MAGAVVDRLRLIAQIVANALARKGADLALRRAHAFEALVAELATTLAGVLTEPVDDRIETVLGRIADFLGADRATVLQGHPPDPLVRTHQWVREGWPPVAGSEAAAAFPWSIERVFEARKPVVFARLDELPPAAARDREGFDRLGIKSGVVRPLIVDDQVIGALVFGALEAPRRWPPELVDRLGLVSELVASTLARHRADAELRAALTENEQLRARLEAENRYLQAEVHEEHAVDDIVGRSAALQAVLRKVEQVARRARAARAGAPRLRWTRDRSASSSRPVCAGPPRAWPRGPGRRPRISPAWRAARPASRPGPCRSSRRGSGRGAPPGASGCSRSPRSASESSGTADRAAPDDLPGARPRGCRGTPAAGR